jgi:hypothetical protein
VVLPTAQLPADEQQPPLHSWLALHEVVQWWFDKSHAWPTAQSVALLQPHAPDDKQAVPFALPTQVAQVEPTAPHTVCDVPGMQVPLVADEQQPDKHAIPVPQVFTHSLLVLQLVDEPGQSPIALQPHCPPPVTAMHWCPFWLLVQSPHDAPLLPQIVGAVPVWHVPDDPQQPPLHSVFMSHAEPQVCVVVLHAWFGKQSLELVQPHTLLAPLARHAEPALLPVQAPHTACPSAHDGVDVPGSQVPPKQQPPLHGCVALHEVVQVPLARSHDWPVGQSPGPAQLAVTPPPSPLPPPPPSPPRSPTPASPAALIASVIASQPPASVRAALIAEPSATPPPSAVTVTLTMCPAG